jgi:hypothetical protein
VVSGAIDASHVATPRRAGIRHVVNLRPAEENPEFDEASVVAEQGLEYHSRRASFLAERLVSRSDHSNEFA